MPRPKKPKKPKMAKCQHCGWYIGRGLLKKYDGSCPHCKKEAE